MINYLTILNQITIQSIHLTLIILQLGHLELSLNQKTVQELHLKTLEKMNVTLILIQINNKKLNL
jgi:hypothetical protein